MKGSYVRLRDARDGGYKIRVKATPDIDGWFHVLSVDENHVLLMGGKGNPRVHLSDVHLLVEDEDDKAINRKLDEGSL